MKVEPSRPSSVTGLAIGVLVLAAGNAVRLVAGLARYSLLQELGLSVPPVYLIASGGVWAMVGLGLAAGLWSGAGWARRLTPAAAILYSFQFWLDRLVFSVAGTANVNAPFAAVVNMLVLAWLWFILSRPGARSFFDEARVGHIASSGVANEP